MNDKFDFDDNYEPPSREFIRNSLTYGLLDDSPVLQHVPADLEYASIGHGKFMRSLIEFVFNNEERTKRIPVLGNLMLLIKRRMMRKTLVTANSDVPMLDLSGIMGFEVDEFIRQLYALALNRAPDVKGMDNHRRALYSGASKEAIVYIVCTSKEFGRRAQVVHLDQYRKAYWRYRFRYGLRSLPVIGWIWAVFAMPFRINRTMVGESQRSEVLRSQLNSLKTRTEALHLENAARIRELSSQVEGLRAENIASLRKLSSQIELLDASYRLDIEKAFSQLDALRFFYDDNFKNLISTLGVVNQNIINANVKLDETGSLIINLADRDRPPVYSLPGGVTAVPTKEYIIGVPSEQWRLAVFIGRYGGFEIGAERYFRSILEKGMNVVDVGAYVGIYTLHALAAGCQVYSYEPTPKIFDILSDNVGINGFEPTGRANLFNLAVSDTESEAELALYGDGKGQNNSLFATSTGDKKIIVKTTYLDKHIGHLDHIDVAKIDAEGAEPLILRGMRKIITQNPGLKIIMEFAPSHLKRGGNDPRDFIGEIRAMGLDFHLIDAESGEIRKISDEDLCAAYSINVLLAKPS